MMAAAKSLVYGGMALMLLAGGAALAYARWTVPIAEGDRALADGQLDRALAAFSRAEGRFDRLTIAKRLFADEYQRVLENELWTMYRLGRYDETIEKADHAPDASAPHFWSGCAFFEKAVVEEQPEARLGDRKST